jgi:hypothetical protein
MWTTRCITRMLTLVGMRCDNFLTMTLDYLTYLEIRTQIQTELTKAQSRDDTGYMKICAMDMFELAMLDIEGYEW